MPKSRKAKIVRRRGASPAYWVVAVGLAAVAVYLNAPGNEFVLDDIRLIHDNVRIRSLANVPYFFVSSYWEFEGAHALYRPLVLASYAVNYAASGLSPSSYSVVNIALHAAVSVLLCALVRSLGATLAAAGMTGLLFAVHPVHTEAVTGISGRPELLAALFFLLALHFHRLAPGGGLRYRAAVAGSFACALLSKESAMTLLLVLPVMDTLLPATRSDGLAATPRSRLLADYLPLAVVALAYLALRRWVIGGITIAADTIAPLDNPIASAGSMPAIMTAFAVIVEYARVLIYPAQLSPDYSYNQIPLVTRAMDSRFIAGLLIVAGCLVASAWLWRRQPLAAFGLAFMALTFSIVSNFAVPIGTICAERLMYLPSAGLLISAAVAAERLAELAHGVTKGSTRRRIAYGVVALLIVLGAARTWTRNRDWSNELTLWTSAVEAAPNSARVQSEYGRVLMGRAQDAAESGRSDAESLYASAQAHFETALKISPTYSLPLDGLAMIHSLHGRFDEAAVFYERALNAWPGNYASLTNWGSLLWERAKRDAAAALALRQQGRIAEADTLARGADDDCRQALAKIDQAIAVMPTYAHSHLVRAQILDTYVGDPHGAITAFEEVLRLAPNHPQRALIERELQRLRSGSKPIDHR
jgi:tetratricopeptide (TPR) repeat protein